MVCRHTTPLHDTELTLLASLVTIVTMILVLRSYMYEPWYVLTVRPGQFQAESGSLISVSFQFILSKCESSRFIHSSSRSNLFWTVYVNSLLATSVPLPSWFLLNWCWFVISLNTRKHLRALTDETIEFALPTITAATCVSLDSDALSANRTSTHIQPSVWQCNAIALYPKW
jgi:hypothetical protein